MFRLKFEESSRILQSDPGIGISAKIKMSEIHLSLHLFLEQNVIVLFLH